MSQRSSPSTCTLRRGGLHASWHQELGGDGMHPPRAPRAPTPGGLPSCPQTALAGAVKQQSEAFLADCKFPGADSQCLQGCGWISWGEQLDPGQAERLAGSLRLQRTPCRFQRRPGHTETLLDSSLRARDDLWLSADGMFQPEGFRPEKQEPSASLKGQCCSGAASPLQSEPPWHFNILGADPSSIAYSLLNL